MEKRYYKHKLEDFLVVSKIITIHYFQFDKSFCAEGESHDFWELVFAEKKQILCTADGQQTTLNEGELIFHKPNEFHSLSANGKDSPNVLIISFACKSPAMSYFEGKKFSPDKKLTRYLFSILNEGKKTFEIPYSDPETKKMQVNKNPPLGGGQIIKNNLELFLIHLLRSETEKKAESLFLAEKDYDNRTANAVTRYLWAHVFDRVSMDDVSRELNYNKSYIFRQFKMATGSTVMEYFISIKIEKAKQMLDEGVLNVSQIAYALSFDTPNYFTKTFKKHVGVTPVVYRKKGV